MATVTVGDTTHHVVVTRRAGAPTVISLEHAADAAWAGQAATVRSAGTKTTTIEIYILDSIDGRHLIAGAEPVAAGWEAADVTAERERRQAV